MFANIAHWVPLFLRDVWASVGIVDLIDITVIAGFLYLILGWLQRKTSRSLLIVLVPLALVFAAATLLDMYLTSLLFQVGLTAFSAALVVIFQEDFRRGFELTRTLSEEIVNLPTRVILRNIQPREIRLQLYPMEMVTLPVMVRWKGHLPSPLPTVKLDPSLVEVKMRKGTRAPTSTLTTEPVSLAELQAKKRLQARLILPPEAQISQADPLQTTLTLLPALP